MPDIKKAARKIVEKLQKGDGILFTTEKGLYGGEQIPVRKAVRELRKQGIDAEITSGIYKGNKEPSIFVSNLDDKKRAFIEALSKKTGQESILNLKPGGAELKMVSGPEAGSVIELPGFSISDKPLSSEAQTKFRTSTGSLYVTYGTGEQPGIHYSRTEGIKELDPAMAGTGANAPRDMRKGPPTVKTLYTYGDVAAEPEPQLGKSKYLVSYNPESLYDMQKDPQGFFEKARQDMLEGRGGFARDPEDLAKQYARDAGFEGVSWDMGGKQGPVVEFFKKRPVMKTAAIGGAALGLGVANRADARERILQKISERLAERSAEIDKAEKEARKEKAKAELRAGSGDLMQKFMGTFRDTGRTADSPGEYMDAVFGVPVRVAINEAQKGNFGKSALRKILDSIGKDPQKQPTSLDIAYDTGIKNPYLGAAISTAVELGAQVPMPGNLLNKSGGGLAGKFFNDTVDNGKIMSLSRAGGAFDDPVKPKTPAVTRILSKIRK